MFIIIVCFCAAGIGLFVQFFHKPQIEEDEKVENQYEIDQTEDSKEETTEVDAYDYSDKSLPDVDNTSSDETYAEFEVEHIQVYFSNTAMLDQCSMPTAVQSELALDTQKFLEMQGYDVTELIIDNNEFIEDDNKVLFECVMPGYAEKLQITYDKKDSTLYFAIIEDDGTEG